MRSVASTIGMPGTLLFQTVEGATARSNPFMRPCRTIRKGQFENCETVEINEIDVVARLFKDAA